MHRRKRTRLGALALFAIASGAGALAGDIEPARDGWQYACLEKGRLVESEPSNLESLRNVAVAHFDAEPLTGDRDVLDLGSTLEDKASARTVLVFDTLLMSDTSVVYVFDENSEIVDHFALSSWQSAERGSTPAGSYRARCR